MTGYNVECECHKNQQTKKWQIYATDKMTRNARSSVQVWHGITLAHPHALKIPVIH